MSRILTIVLTAMLFPSCSMFTNEQLISNSVTGKWEWTMTSGGWGTHIAADSVDYSMTVMIYSQNEAEWYRNDSLLHTYQIKKGEEGKMSMHSTSETSCNTFSLTVTSDEEELLLNTIDCTDQPNHYFRRAKN